MSGGLTTLGQGSRPTTGNCLPNCSRKVDVAFCRMPYDERNPLIMLDSIQIGKGACIVENENYETMEIPGT